MRISNTSIRSKTRLFLWIGYLILILYTRIIQNRYGPLLRELLICAGLICVYLIISLFIWVERNHLVENHIDKLSFFMILLFGSILRPIFISNSFFRVNVWLFFFSIAFLLFITYLIKKITLPQTPNIGIWILVGFLWGIFEFILWACLGSSCNIDLSWLSSNSIGNTLIIFRSALSDAAISEETIYRGFLWGTMRKWGFTDKRILFIQAILFALQHLIIYYPSQGIIYFIQSFIFGIVMGLLVWKSRSIVPCLVAHGLRNTVVLFYLGYSL